MAKGRVVKSAINAALDNVKAGQKAAKEVIEGTSKSANKYATMVKNCVNTVQSNLGSGQAKAVASLGENSGRALREGIQNAANQVNVKPVSKVLEDSANRGQSAARKAYEAVNNKRVNQVIDGHNAEVKANMNKLMMDEAKFNSVVYHNNVPKNHEAARNAVHKANESVRNSYGLNKQNTANQVFNETYGNNWRENSYQGKPVIGYNRDNYQMHTQNTGSQASPFLIENRRLQNEAEFYDNRRTNINDTMTGPTKANAEQMDKTNARYENQGNQKTTEPKTTRTNPFKDPKAQEALNGVTGFAKEMFGGVTDTYKGVRNGQGIVDSFVNAHKNADGTTNMLRAAGTFMAVSSAARVASGGGLYKDRYGNPNLIGVPFI